MTKLEMFKSIAQGGSVEVTEVHPLADIDKEGFWHKERMSHTLVRFCAQAFFLGGKLNETAKLTQAIEDAESFFIAADFKRNLSYASTKDWDMLTVDIKDFMWPQSLPKYSRCDSIRHVTMDTESDCVWISPIDGCTFYRDVCYPEREMWYYRNITKDVAKWLRQENGCDAATWEQIVSLIK